MTKIVKKRRKPAPKIYITGFQLQFSRAIVGRIAVNKKPTPNYYALYICPRFLRKVFPQVKVNRTYRIHLKLERIKNEN